MSKTYKNCQSCGMPLKDDPKGGGTNADGSRSMMYCSYCYQGGQFTEPNMTAQEMEMKVKGILKKMGPIHRIFAGPFAKSIHKLERWRKNP